MRVMGYDCEASGLQTDKDLIIDIGVAVWDTTRRTILQECDFRVRRGDDYVVSPEITALTGHVTGDLIEFGRPLGRILQDLEELIVRHQVAYLVAHNGRAYDEPLLRAEIQREGLDLPYLSGIPWIDTRTDIPYPAHIETRKLRYLAYEHDVPVTFSHRALADVRTMLAIFGKYEIEKIVEYRSKPSITIRAMVPHPKHDNGAGKDKAKAAGYRWQEADGRPYPNQWVKRIKLDELPAERQKLPGYEIIEVV